ncbi:MAG: ribosomal protein, partial [Bacteroidota bacterium]
VYEDERPEAKEAAEKKSARKSAKKDDASQVTSTSSEKTTLGDIEGLAALRDKLSGDNK